jgi:ATP-dependent RNA helicase DeaD
MAGTGSIPKESSLSVVVDEPVTGFHGLGLSPTSLEAIAAVNYQVPSPIQAAFIPRALTGADVIGQARTGTGKTAAFVLPILERIDADDPRVQAIALVPTRELGEQVATEAARLSRNRPVKTVCCVGGKYIRRQIEALKAGSQLVVGTPGRVLDLISRRLLILDNIRIVVLDEADRMLDIGFRPDIERILRRCPTERQTLLLSATLPGPVERLAQRYMRHPERVDLSGDKIAVDTVQQFYITVEQEQKFQTLVRLLLHQRPRQAIVFCRTKRGADKLYSKLSAGLPGVAVMHGDLQQSARDRAMKQFREGKTRLLIATDVMGRGIDVSGISHIINFDVPEFCDDYVHRVGRTGRLSGEQGYAFTMVTRSEGDQLTSIEKRINYMLPQFHLPDMDELRRFAAPRTLREPESECESRECEEVGVA